MVVILLVLAALFDWNYECLVHFLAPSAEGVTLSLFLLALSALIVGEILDVIRDSFLEPRWDVKHQIRWKFFFEGEAEKLKNLEQWYYTWYVFDINLRS